MRTLCQILVCAAVALSFCLSAEAQDYDIMVEEITSPKHESEHPLGYPIDLEAVLTNLGPSDAPFAIVEFRVETEDGEVVHGPENIFVDNLGAGESFVAQSYSPWTPLQTGYFRVVVTSTMTDLNPLNDQLTNDVFTYEVLITQDQAITTVLNNVIPQSQYADQLVAFLYNSQAVNSWLPIGASVADYAETFNNTLTAKTYFFWFDNVQDADWMHPATFVYVNAWTGAYTVTEAESWPVVNGTEILTFTQQGNSSPDRVYGTYGSHPSEIVNYTGIDQPANTTWCLIFSGKNINGGGERRARENDVNRIRNYVNNNPRGPQIDNDNITVLTGTNFSGATEQEVCDALDAMEDCDKLYIYYAGHGSKKGEACLRGGKMSWEKLACKLIDNGAEEVCANIEACYSGTACEALMEKTQEGEGGEQEGLSGEVTYSSSSDKVTKRIDGCGTPYYKGLESCTADLQGDANGDGKVSNKEAMLWAAANDPLVANQMPGCTNLDNGSTTTVTGKRTKKSSSSKTGKTIKYTVCSTCYITETPPQQTEEGAGDDNNGDGGSSTGETKRDTSWITRVYAYATNPRKTGDKVDLCCDGVVIGTFDGKLPKKTKVCIATANANCKKFKIKKSSSTIKPVTKDRTTSLLNQDDAVVYQATHSYFPGQNLYWATPIEEEPNHTINASVDPVSGWNLGVNPTTLTTSVLVNPETVVLTGTVPTTATVGTAIIATMTDQDDGSLTYQLVDALVYTTINSNIVDGGNLSFNEVDLYGGIYASNGLIDITDASIHYLQDNVDFDVAANGTLKFSNSIIEPAGGVDYLTNIAGTLEWRGSGLVGPVNGLYVNGADGFIEGGGIHDSQGDGVTLTGNLSGLTIDGLEISNSGGDGMVIDGSFNITVEGADISGSTGDDLVLQNSAFVFMKNSFYDQAKEVLVDAGSILVRSWSTTFYIENQDGEPLTNASVTVLDANAAPVTTLTVDAEGFTSTLDLYEYARAGGSTAFYTPHIIGVTYNGSTTISLYTADSPNVHEMVIATPLITDVGDDRPAQQRASGPELTVTPTPAFNNVAVGFTLEHTSPAVLRILDLSGREVARPFSGRLGAGEHKLAWDAAEVPVGAYFAVLEVHGAASVARIVLQR